MSFMDDPYLYDSSGSEDYCLHADYKTPGHDNIDDLQAQKL